MFKKLEERLKVLNRKHGRHKKIHLRLLQIEIIMSEMKNTSGVINERWDITEEKMNEF